MVHRIHELFIFQGYSCAMEEFAFTEEHFGTSAVISIVCPTFEEAKQLAAAGFLHMTVAEKIFSRFMPDSELSRLNKAGTLVVSDIFIELLEAAISLTHATGGAFNPLSQITKLGYTDTFSNLADGLQTTDSSPYRTDIDAITINKETNTVTLANQQQLDFGGIAKGFLAEKIATNMKVAAPNCVGIIVNLGGDLYTLGHGADGEPFIFFIYNPVTETELPLVVQDQALTTSGTYKRHWNTRSGPKHHIVDPNTRENPETKITSSSTIHPRGAVAEAWAKYFLVNNIPTTISPPEDLTYLLIYTEGTVKQNYL